ncbi:MAG: NAD(P)-dependent alcohol dehydrogenase [Brevinematales bacterium]|jgi:NADPH:quinone reductase-like Zn-dependent oxidoreductase
MKAVICTKYGPPEVLKMAEVEKPVPGDNEVLIKVYATTVTIADSRIRGFNIPPLFRLPFRIMFGFGKPNKPVLGMQLSGVIESVGKNVQGYKPGDRVFAYTGFSFGAYVEYRCFPENGLIALIPAGKTYEEAAAVSFGGFSALHFIKQCGINRGQKVLVYGASGDVGTNFVQLAVYYGAEVTGVSSTPNLELVSSLGAGRVIDYTKEDFTVGGERYDIIFDAVGIISKSKAVKALKPGGKFYSVMNGIIKANQDDLALLRHLLEAGNLKPVIDRTYTFEQLAEAHRYVDIGHKKGNVVIKVGTNN